MYVECPTEYEAFDRLSIFLAGGITGCPDWQADARVMLEGSGLGLDILNPRRQNFPTDPGIADEQIAWEHRHLRKARAILFWFPKETLCPITLYELGAWSVAHPWKPLFVGCEPGYQRTVDVVIQTRLVRPDVEVVDNLPALVQRAVNYMQRMDRLNGIFEDMLQQARSR
jgi:hypothetical protein